MTLIVGTVTPTRGWLSADAELSGPHQLPSAAFSSELAEMYDVNTTEGLPKLIEGTRLEARKLLVFPAARLAMATAGPLMLGFALGLACRSARSPLDLFRIVPETWDSLASVAGKIRATVIAIIWNEELGEVAGYEWPNHNGGRRLPDETLWTPTPDAGGEHVDEIRAGLEPARRGEGVQHLHDLIALNVAAASRRNAYAGVLIGGRLQTAVVSADGVTVSDGVDLDSGALAAA